MHGCESDVDFAGPEAGAMVGHRTNNHFFFHCSSLSARCMRYWRRLALGQLCCANEHRAQLVVDTVAIIIGQGCKTMIRSGIAAIMIWWRPAPCDGKRHEPMGPTNTLWHFHTLLFIAYNLTDYILARNLCKYSGNVLMFFWPS